MLRIIMHVLSRKDIIEIQKYWRRVSLLVAFIDERMIKWELSKGMFYDSEEKYTNLWGRKFNVSHDVYKGLTDEIIIKIMLDIEEYLHLLTLYQLN